MPDLEPGKDEMNPFEELSGDDEKNEKEDPWEEYMKLLQEMVESMTSSPDTATDPMEMLDSDPEAMSSLNDMDTASTGKNAKVTSTADADMDLDSSASLEM